MCLVNKNLLIEIFNENYRNVIISDGGREVRVHLRVEGPVGLQPADDLVSVGLDDVGHAAGQSRLGQGGVREHVQARARLYGIFNNPLAKFHFFGYTYLHRKPFSDILVLL